MKGLEEWETWVVNFGGDYIYNKAWGLVVIFFVIFL